jgi:endonuclease/exonuclease/phosphatase family metal-dependent hydrolase
MPVTPIRKRTIAMPETRSRQVAVASAHLDVTGEEFIQSAITAALLSLCEADRSFCYALARAAGVEFETLEFTARQEALANLLLIVTPRL